MSEERVNERDRAAVEDDMDLSETSDDDEANRAAEGRRPSTSDPASPDPGGTDSDSLRAEFEELSDRHLRLAAEFNNFRRRAESEALGTWSRAQADLIERFLDVLDDLQRVAGLDPEDEKVTVQSIVDGIDLVERKFVRVLEDAGTDTIEPGEGEPFDPERMEALMRVPTEDESMDDAVAQTFQKGYLVDGSLVRAARVSVYKAD